MSHILESSALAGGDNWPNLRRRRPPGASLPIWQAHPRHSYRFVVWGRGVLAWTHWTGLRTIGCPGRQHECPWCGVQEPRAKWYHGAFALQPHPELRWAGVDRCAVELPINARQSQPRLALLDSCRGCQLILSRQYQRRNALVLCGLAQAPKREQLPAVALVDPAQVLLRTWTQGPDCLTADQVRTLLDLAAKLDIDGGPTP